MSNWPADETHEYDLKQLVVNMKHFSTVHQSSGMHHAGLHTDVSIPDTTPKTNEELRHENTGLRTDVNILNEQQHDMAQKIKLLEQTVDMLKHMSNILPYAKIESSIKKNFSTIPTIKSIYVEPAESGLLLTLVHDSKYIFHAIEQAQPGLIILEDEFPDVYFDTRFLHINEVHGIDLSQSVLVF